MFCSYLFIAPTPNNTGLDYVLIREGKNIKFNIKDVGEDESFKYEEGPLSDHPALFVELSVSS